jgi:hypothetical protein
VKNLLRDVSVAAIVRLAGGRFVEIERSHPPLRDVVWFSLSDFPGLEINVALDDISIKAVKRRIRDCELPSGHPPDGWSHSCIGDWGLD